MFRGGTYFLSAKEVFTLADSGSAAHPVVYTSYPGEMATISGGKVLTGFKFEHATGRWTLRIPSVASGTWYFGNIWVNGNRARWPIRPVPGGDRFHVAAKVASSGSASGDAITPPGKGLQEEVLAKSTATPSENSDRFGFNPGELNSNWTNPTDIRIRVSHTQAASSLIPVASIDMIHSVMTLNSHTVSDTMPVGTPWRRENVYEDLGTEGQVGEMYLNRKTGVLTYIPRAGEIIENSTIIAPVIDQLIVISNAPAYGKPGSTVGNITFRNLTFANTSSYSLVKGHLGHFNNDHLNPYAAITTIGATGVTVDRCTFKNIGEMGLMFGPGSTGNSATSNVLYDLGSSGIGAADHYQLNWISDSSGLYYGAYKASTALGGTGNTKISNNSIHDYGKVLTSSDGIYLGVGRNNTVSYNVIYNGPSWGIRAENLYVDDNTIPDLNEYNNYIGHNLIYEMGWDEGRGASLANDYGGLYVNMRGIGNLIEYNTVHDVHSSFPTMYGGESLQPTGGDNNALYVDGDSSFLTIQNNLFYNGENTIMVLKGSGHVVQNNIFYGKFRKGIKSGLGGTAARAIFTYPFGDGELTPLHISPAMNFQHNIVAFDDGAADPWTINAWLWNSNGSSNHGLSQKPTISENNLYFKYGSTITDYSADLTFAEWQRAGHDLHSKVNDDPQFANPSEGDFSLKPNSPAFAVGFLPFEDGLSKCDPALGQLCSEK
jgi:hypothetical protein